MQHHCFESPGEDPSGSNPPSPPFQLFNLIQRSRLHPPVGTCIVHVTVHVTAGGGGGEDMLGGLRKHFFTIVLEVRELFALHKLPPVPSCGLSGQVAGRTQPVGLVAVMGPRPEAEVSDEWMYELEHKAQRDVYSPIEQAFGALLSNKGDARAYLHQLEPGDLALPGAVRVQHIMDHHGGNVQAYFAAQKLHGPVL